MKRVVKRIEGYTGELISNPVKAIKAKCLDCSGYEKSEIKLCTCFDCPLWPFRNGKNPYRTKREMSEDQKEKIKERFNKN